MNQLPAETPSLTVARTAERIGVSTGKVRDWADEGRLRCFRLPPRGERRFFPSDVDRFIAEHTDGIAS